MNIINLLTNNNTNTHTQDGTPVAIPHPYTDDNEPEPTPTSLSLGGGEINKIPPLEKQFKKPPPLKNRRTPSKEHLKQMAGVTEDGETVCVVLFSVS